MKDKEIEAYKSYKDDDPGLHESMFPSDSAGDGLLVPNNVITGATQGIGSFRRKAHCKQCGFLLDLFRDDTTGGSLDGNGAISVAKETRTYVTSGGTTVTEYVGVSSSGKGAGCPHCGSKNGSSETVERIAGVQPIPIIGF